MTLAGIELRFLVNEITKKTRNYYVSNIYGIARDSILFKLHHPDKQDIHLMITTFGMWTSSVKIQQIEPNNLLKRLRNDLVRARLTSIKQVGTERIVYLTFSNSDKEFVLVAEFFGDGNIILCNNEMKILALLHSIDVRHRKLAVGLQYTLPPQQGLDVFDITQNDLEPVLSSPIQVAKWIGRNLGLPTKYVEEILRRAEVDSKSQGNSLSNDDVKRIFDSVNNVIKNVVEGPHNPVIVQDDNNDDKKKPDVYPIKIGQDSENYTKVPSFMEGLDIFFTQTIVNKGQSLQSSSTDKKIEELENKLNEQTKAITTVKEKSSAISAVAKSLLDLMSKGSSSSIGEPVMQKHLLSKHQVQIIKEKGIPMIKIRDEKIKINPDASIQATASLLFDESKRQLAAVSSIEQLKKKTQKSIEKLKKDAKTTRESVGFSQVRKKNWFERYRWFYTSDGFLAIGGRDASSNSAVIRKHLDKHDKVFHAEIHGSPFFVLKKGTDSSSLASSIPPSPASLNEMAHATVCFSRAWREAMYGLGAYWVEPHQVKKAAPSGQFLAKGSFTIEGQRNFIKVSTLRLAVGLLQEENGGLLLTCGPPGPIKEKCLCYAVIEPTGSEMVSVAKKIKTEFMKLKEDLAKSISLDDFVRVLPAGTSHVIESGFGGGIQKQGGIE